jgi:hypothetical protein
LFTWAKVDSATSTNAAEQNSFFTRMSWGSYEDHQ